MGLSDSQNEIRLQSKQIENMAKLILGTEMTPESHAKLMIEIGKILKEQNSNFNMNKWIVTCLGTPNSYRWFAKTIREETTIQPGLLSNLSI